MLHGRPLRCSEVEEHSQAGKMGKTNREEEEAKLGGEEDTFEFDATAAVEEALAEAGYGDNRDAAATPS